MFPLALVGVGNEGSGGDLQRQALAANLGKVVSTDTLLVRGWAETEDADPSYVWVTMRRLRQKLEVDPNRPIHLLTVRGVGYRLVAASSSRPGNSVASGGG